MFSRLVTLKTNTIEREKAIAWMVFFSFIIMMLGCSRTIYNVYTPDDFLLASQKMPLSFYLNQGRFIQAVITGFFNYIDINIISSSPIFTPLFFLSTSLASSLMVYTLLPKNSSFIISCLLSGLIVSHPVFSMMSVYHLAVVCFSLCMFCVVGYIVSFDKFIKSNKKHHAFISCLFVVLVCGNYQPAFIVIVMYSITRLYVIEKKLFTFYNFKTLYPIALGLVIYATVFKITKNILGENNWDTRTGLIDNIPLRFHEIFSFIPSLFYKNWWVIPKQLGIILSLSLFLYLITYSSKSRKLNTQQILIPIILIAAIITPLSLLKVWDPTPRALFSISFFYSSIIIIFYNEAMIKIKAVLLSVAIFFGLLSSNSFLYQIEMVQKKDTLLAIKSFYLIKSSGVKAKRIAIANNNAISVDYWALNGLIYFLTNENMNISSPTNDEIRQCDEFKNETRLIEDNDSILVCLSR